MTAFHPTEIPAVIEIVPPKFGDHRGFFSEVYKRPAFAAAGIDIDWMQDNQSFSAAKGTLRGLHYQSPPKAQDKLVRCSRGAIACSRSKPTTRRCIAASRSIANWPRRCWRRRGAMPKR